MKIDAAVITAYKFIKEKFINESNLYIFFLPFCLRLIGFQIQHQYTARSLKISANIKDLGPFSVKRNRYT